MSGTRPGAETSSEIFVAKRIPRDRATRIVDLGCGQASLLHSLWRAGYRNISGVEISGEQIEVARRFGLPVEQGTIENFLSQTEDCSVDVVLAIDVLEHTTREELLRLLDAIVRKLKPGGKCIAHVPNAEGIHGMGIRYGDLTHEQAFTKKSLEQILAAVGFTGIQCFEDKPLVQGAFSLARRIVWDLGTIPHRVLLAAETGFLRGALLSRNIFVEAQRSEATSHSGAV
jgi:SAM-dependent methyltransferase